MPTATAPRTPRQNWALIAGKRYYHRVFSEARAGGLRKIKFWGMAPQHQKAMVKRFSKAGFKVVRAASAKASKPSAFGYYTKQWVAIHIEDPVAKIV